MARSSSLLLAAVLISAPVVARAQTAVTLSTGFTPDPLRITGTSGGSIAAQSRAPDCRGFITPTAHVALTVPTGLAFLRIFVQAANDTTLVIRAPNGQWICNDDRYRYDPGIDAAVGPGTYLVWVGSYVAADAHPFTMTLSASRLTVPVADVAATNDAGTGTTLATPTGAGTVARASSTGGGRIFDNHTTVATATIAQACVVNGLTLRVSGNHTYNSDLVVRLRGPSGQTETLQSHQSRNPFRTYTSRQFKNAQGAGVWTLSIADTVGADSGTLERFALELACQ